MRNISNTTGSISYGETSWEAGDTPASVAREKYQDLINKANSVPIQQVFKLYGIKLDEINRKTTCPFKSHKGGRESTASFYWYPNTNTYCCYGCRQGSHPVDFVQYMDGTTKTKAAQKILDKLSSEIDDNAIVEHDNFSETMQIIISFSNHVREFRNNFSDEKSIAFIEDKCQIYDKITEKHQLNNDGLKSLVIQLIQTISQYSL
jgi:hypothetical protein